MVQILLVRHNLYFCSFRLSEYTYIGRSIGTELITKYSVTRLRRSFVVTAEKAVTCVSTKRVPSIWIVIFERDTTSRKRKSTQEKN